MLGEAAALFDELVRMLVIVRELHHERRAVLDVDAGEYRGVAVVLDIKVSVYAGDSGGDTVFTEQRGGGFGG